MSWRLLQNINTTHLNDIKIFRLQCNCIYEMPWHAVKAFNKDQSMSNTNMKKDIFCHNI